MVLASTLSSCASIVNGTKQSVSVTTPPVHGAACTLANSKGTWYINKTPGSVIVHRAYDSLKVTCRKIGCRSVKKKIKSHTKAMTAGNILFGGVIGLGVDAVNGAAYDYPQSIVVPMKCKAKTSSSCQLRKEQRK